MSDKVAFIHTGPASIDPLNNLKNELLEDVEVINLVDDSLLRDSLKAGHVTSEVMKRMTQYMIVAEQMGVKAILNCCSSVGEAADYIENIISTPIIKIDNRMAYEAVGLGKKIGIVGTVKTTLNPTVALVKKKALEQGKEVAIDSFLCSEAYEAVVQGDGEKHDQLVMEAVEKMAETNDVIVLAQVSMARLIAKLSPDFPIPVLASPRLGMEELAETLRSSR